MRGGRRAARILMCAAGLMCAAAVAAGVGCSRGKAPPKAPDAAATGSSMREEALTGTAQKFGVNPENGIWGLVLELGAPIGPSTLVVLADGRAHLAWGGGTTVIKDRGHARVRAGAERLMELAVAAKAEAVPTTDFRWAKEGVMRFYFLTDTGVLLAEGEAAKLDDIKHPLSRMFMVGNDLITKIRLAAAGDGL